MPVPRQRLSSRRGRTRAAHHGLAAITTTSCPQCKAPMLPHVACPTCGYYKGHNTRERLGTVATPAKPAAAESAQIKPETAAASVTPDTPVAQSPSTSAN